MVLRQILDGIRAIIVMAIIVGMIFFFMLGLGEFQYRISPRSKAFSISPPHGAAHSVIALEDN